MSRMHLYIKPLARGLKVEPGIIKAADYASYCDAKGLISLARAEASYIKKDAERKAASKVSEAYLVGLEKAQAEVAHKMVTAKIRANQMIEHAQDDLIELVRATVEQLFGQVPEEQQLTGLIMSALTSLRDEYKVQLRVFPSQVSLVKTAVPEFINEFRTLELIEVIGDYSVDPGECLIEGDGGVLKCSAAQQFEKLTDILVHTINNEDLSDQ